MLVKFHAWIEERAVPGCGTELHLRGVSRALRGRPMEDGNAGMNRPTTCIKPPDRTPTGPLDQIR